MTQISPLDGGSSQIKWRIPKGNCQLAVVIFSITHRFLVIREFSDFYETKSDIAPISPLGGVSS